MNLEGLTPSSTHVEPSLPEQRRQLERDLQERTAELLAAKEALEREIADRTRVQHALSESESRYRSVVNALGEGVVMVGVDGSILACNPSAEKIFGIPAREFVKSTLADPRWRVVDEQGNPLPRERWHVLQAFKHGEAFKNIIIGMYKPDGALIWLEGNIQPLYRAFETRPYAIVASFFDITERKKARERLEHSLSLLTATLESTTDGILVVDSQGKINSYNQKFISMWHIPAEIVQSRDDKKALDFVLNQLKDPPGFINKVNELYAHPEAESYDVLKFKDGRIFERYSKPQRLGAQMIGRVWTFRDVTERKRLEDQLRQSQKMEAVGRLAGGIAHDFNNILTAITGYTEMLLGRLHTSDPACAEVMEIKRASDQASMLIRQLLAFSRQQIIQPKVLNLNTVIRGMDKLLQRVVGENIDLQWRLVDDVGNVKIDLSQLEQVLMNLTVNARDAMPNGGGLLIRTEHLPRGSSSPGLDPNLAQARSYTMLLVRDTGMGIAPEIQSQIFEPFFTTKERGKGTGLGLATVYAVVSQCQGTIAVESAPGKGATFRIYLPCSDEPPSQVQTPSPRKGSETVLVVEDDDSLRRLLVKSLEKSGYKVLAASTGDEAIQSFHKYPPIDLLLTDVVLPHMSGREVAERLTSLRPDMKVLFMSGYAPDIISNQGVLDSDAAFIAKPFTVEMLAHQVREQLDCVQPKK